MIDIALVGIDGAAVAIGAGVLRIEPDRVVQIGDGAVEVALVGVNDGAVEIDAGVSGIKPERVIIVGDGMIEVALFGIGAAAAARGLPDRRQTGSRQCSL
jgi:hypothetical protein